MKSARAVGGHVKRDLTEGEAWVKTGRQAETHLAGFKGRHILTPRFH